MSLVTLNPAAALIARRMRKARRRRQALMGSWLSEWIRKRKKKGIDLNMKVGKGNLSYNVPAATAPGTPGLIPSSGPIAWAKNNPAIVAGIGGGLLITTLMVMKRKKKGGRR